MGKAVELETQMLAARVQVLVVARPEQAEPAYRQLYSSLGQMQAVGVDCEGQGQTAGSALMCQVSSLTICVVEVSNHWHFSDSLTKLLADASIQKIFCGAGGDVDAIPSKVANVVDVQRQVALALRTSQTPGLSKVLEFADPHKREWSKQKFGKNGWFRLRSGEMMLRAKGFVQYAAADAWGTLRAFSWLQSSATQSTGKSNVLKRKRTEDTAAPLSQRQRQQAQKGSGGGKGSEQGNRSKAKAGKGSGQAKGSGYSSWGKGVSKGGKGVSKGGKGKGKARRIVKVIKR